MKDVGEDGFQGGEKGTEEREEKTPRCKVIVAEGAVREKKVQEMRQSKLIGVNTYANPTPAITGKSETSFLAVYRAFKKA